MAVCRVAICCIALTLGGWAYAQDYPAKPIRIVTSTAGGGTDVVSRLLALGLTAALGQQVVVDNKPSALTGETVAGARPDGYTLLLNGTGFWLAPLVQAKPSYDSVKDFAPISRLTSTVDAIVVHPSVPVHSMREFLALARRMPGQLNYGSSANGTPSHLGAEMLKALTGINIVRITYRGIGTAYAAVVAGEVHMMIPALPSALPYIKAGRLRVLAVTGEKESVFAPGVPAVAQTVPGYRLESTYGLLAPAGTPAPIIRLLHKEVVRLLGMNETKERLFSAGFEVIGSSPEELGATIRSDLKVWARILKETGIRE